MKFEVHFLVDHKRNRLTRCCCCSSQWAQWVEPSKHYNALAQYDTPWVDSRCRFFHSGSKKQFIPAQLERIDRTILYVYTIQVSISNDPVLTHLHEFKASRFMKKVCCYYVFRFVLLVSFLFACRIKLPVGQPFESFGAGNSFSVGSLA
jgi:hypothetical protein